MDMLITIAFLTLYYILGLGTVITLKTGLEEDVELWRRMWSWSVRII